MMSCDRVLVSLFLLLSLFKTATSQLLDNRGREFILGFIPNLVDSNIEDFVVPPPDIELHLTGETATTVDIEYPLGTLLSSADVVPGTVNVVTLPTAAAQSWMADTKSSNLVRASAADEFIVYMVNRVIFSSDAALGLPVDTMNTEYIVLDFTQGEIRDRESQFLVFAAFDDTTVQITPAADLVNHPAGTTFDVVLNRGEGYLARAVTGPSITLTGSIVSANRPVGVANGNICTNAPPGVAFCDHLFEIAQPVQSWGTEIGVANLPQRPGGSIYRVVASEDNTIVTRNDLPLATLDKGEFFETNYLAGNHVFRGDKPIFVAQYMTGSQSPDSTPNGDPSQGNMIPFTQYLSQYTFSTVGGNQFITDYVTIIANNADIGTTLQLDGAVVAASEFTPIPTTEFSAAVIQVSEGTHTTSSANPHGITVEGLNPDDSYIYPGGALFEFINPVDDLNPPVVTLESQPQDQTTVNGVAEDNATPEDTGIFFIDLGEGSTNLEVTPAPFTPGDPVVTFVVSLIDTSVDGSGTVVVTDGAGNKSTVAVTITAVGTLPTPPVPTPPAPTPPTPTVSPPTPTTGPPTTEEPPTPPSMVGKIKSMNYEGCIGTRGGSTRAETKLFLNECQDSTEWEAVPIGDGVILLRNQRDTSQCMHAGRAKTLVDGVPMRIFPCDAQNDMQRMLWDGQGPIKLETRPDLCLVFRGTTANVGHDWIIVKPCDETHPADRLGWKFI